MDDGLGVEKACSELFVVARASHEHGDAFAIETNLERLFYRELIVPGVSRTFLDAIDFRCDLDEDLLIAIIADRRDERIRAVTVLFSRSLMLRRFSIYLWVVAVFVSSEVLARYLGIRFAAETLGTLYQYLDPAVLREDLARGLYYLHAQPPLFNFFLGVVAKMFPESYSAVFSALYGAMALGTLLGMAWLMRRFQIPDGVSGAVCLLFALSPGFPVYRYWLFYTLPVAFLLVSSAVALTVYLERASRAALVTFSGLVLAIMTRAVFHPLWVVVAVRP